MGREKWISSYSRSPARKRVSSREFQDNHEILIFQRSLIGLLRGSTLDYARFNPRKFESEELEGKEISRVRVEIERREVLGGNIRETLSVSTAPCGLIPR